MVAPPMVPDLHFDDDSLSAFIEGRLSEAESAPVISHLVACAFCRRLTAQLVRLETEIGPTEASTAADAAHEPGRIRRLLEELRSRVLPSSEDEAVFAYHAPADDFKQKDEGDKPSAEEESKQDEQAEQKSKDEE